MIVGYLEFSMHYFIGFVIWAHLALIKLQRADEMQNINDLKNKTMYYTSMPIYSQEY